MWEQGCEMYAVGNGSAMKYYFMQIVHTWPTMHYIPLVIVHAAVA